MEIRVKKIILILAATVFSFSTFAQDSTGKRKVNKKDEKRQRIAAMVKQEEEGVLSYTKQTVFGLQLRNNGYGGFVEIGRRRTQRWTNLYSLEITEIKDRKEERVGGEGAVFGNTFIYGKINNFYQAKLGFGQQYILGQKGNKNGVAVTGSFNTGLSIGLLKPYYVQVDSAGGVYIKYEDNPGLFLDRSSVVSGAGITKGWGDLKFHPGVFAKTALRFDFGRYNESVQALEIGISADYYTKKIEIMAPMTDSKATDPKSLFYQLHIAFVFGNRK
jgi:hypothetical protein